METIKLECVSIEDNKLLDAEGKELHSYKPPILLYHETVSVFNKTGVDGLNHQVNRTIDTLVKSGVNAISIFKDKSAYEHHGAGKPAILYSVAYLKLSKQSEKK